MVSASSFLGLPKSEKVLNVFELNDETSISLGTAKGIVKRVAADFAPKAEFEIIALKAGDKVVGADLADDDDEFVFVTNDAQLLRFAAKTVRPQGRGAAGVSGINLATGAEAICFAVSKTGVENIAVTAANSSGSLSGTDAGSIKWTPLGEFPAKGRATGGVRAHKFIRNEDQLYFAWAGPAEAIGLSSDGKQTELPTEPSKRDASGSKATGAIGSIGHKLS
jgi:DNA gyrase subunit A